MVLHQKALAAAALPMLLFWACSHESIVEGRKASLLPEGYTERYHEGMRYGLFVPPAYDSTRSYPLITVLHGSNDTVSWDLSWYHAPVQMRDPCFVLTPKSLVANQGWGNSWWLQHSPDMRKTLQVIARLCVEYNLDTTRLYLQGTSMGGYGVFGVLAKEPGRFAGALAICGGGNSATAEAVKQTPLWIFHGAEDPIVPAQLSRDMYQAILRAGGRHVRYTEYPGVGHAAWTPAWQEPTLPWWLLAQRKGVSHGQPDSVRNLRGEVTPQAHVQLRWDPPADPAKPDNQVWYYRIYRDFNLLAEPDMTHTTYLDTTAQKSTIYRYNLSAVNFFFEQSLRNTPVVVNVPN